MNYSTSNKVSICLIAILSCIPWLLMGQSPPSSNCYNTGVSGEDWNICINNEYAFPDCALITYSADLTNSVFDGLSYPIYAHVTIPTENIEDPPLLDLEPIIEFKSSSFQLVDEYFGSDEGGSDEKYIYVFKINFDDQHFSANFTNLDGTSYAYKGTNVRFGTDLFKIGSGGSHIVTYGTGSTDAWYLDYINDFKPINSIFSSQTYIADKVHIEPNGSNILEVNADLTIEQNSILYINENALIKVKSGNTLKITDSEIRGCGRMWEAIEVESGGNLIIKNSTIQDGYQAVKVNPGANITLESNTFFNNYIGLYADDAVSSQTIILDDVYSNTFQTDYEMENHGFLEEPTQKSNDPMYVNPKSKSYAGLYFKDCDVEFMKSIVHGNDDLNLFRKMHHGIVVDNAEVDMRTCQFKDIRNTSSSTNEVEGAAILQKGGDLRYSGISTFVTETLFDNCEYGLLGDEAGLTSFKYITLNDCQTAIRMENTSFLAYLTNNEITNSKTGIYILDNNRVTTNVRIRYNDISVNYRGIVSAGMAAGMKGNSITLDATGSEDIEFSAGIMTASMSMAPDRPVHASRRPAIVANDITVDKGKRGIHVESGHSFHILDNMVTFNDHIYTIGSNSSGIYLDGGGNHRVKGNCVINNADEFDPNYDAIFRNIYIEQSEGVLMQCNYAETNAAYSKSLINFTGINTMSRIRGNMMTEQAPSSNNTTDLRLGIDENDRSMVGNQSYEGNLWAYVFSGTSGYFRATHESEFEDDYTLSKFYMDPNVDPTNLPDGFEKFENKATPNTGDFEWIVHQSEPQGEETYQCDLPPICIRESSDTTAADTMEVMGDDLPPIVVDSLLIAIISGDSTMNDSLYNFLWIGQRYLITEVEHAVVRDYSSLQLSNFANNYANSDIGQLSKARADLSKNLYVSDSLLSEEIGYWSESFMDIDSLDWGSIDHSVIDVTDSVREENWTEFKTATNQVSTENICGNNEIDVNLAFAKNALDTISPTQLEEMAELAIQCPYVEGHAVYEAIAFLEFQGLLPKSSNHCANEATTIDSREYKKKVMDVIALKVYPNPATNEIYVHFDSDESNQYYIYNAIGQLVQSGTCTSGDRISLANLNTNGLYFLRLLAGDESFHTVSFFIEK